MDAAVGAVIGVLAVLAVFGAMAAMLWRLGVLVLRHRRRAIARGTHPVRLAPWYLGGTPERPLEAPPGEHRTQRRMH